MSLKDVKEGSYKAKAVRGAWMVRGEKKTPCVGLLFEFDYEGRKETIDHYLYLTDKVLSDGNTVASKSFDTLALLGYDERKPLKIDAQGNRIFDKEHLEDKEVEIVLAPEADSRDNGKSYLKVRWVNKIGGSEMAGVAVEQVLGNKNLVAEMAAARARTGAKKAAPASGSKLGGAGTTEDSQIPF